MGNAETEDAAALQRIISPHDTGAFFNEYWEQQPLVVPGSAENDFDDLLTTSDIDHLLSSGQLQPPNIRLVQAGATPDLAGYSAMPEGAVEGRGPVVDPGQIAARFHHGATIVVQDLHHWWSPLAVFCRRLEAGLGHPTQANAYLTPPSAQGLPLHHDTHDVFVLQVSGSKQWQIYPPAVTLPLRHQWSSSQDRPPGEPTLSLTMRKGDALYLPRGWLHEAITTSDESLHLTIGIHAYTWMDALKDALLDCDTEVELRRAVRPDGVAEANLLDLVASRLGPADVAMRMRRRFVGTRRPISSGQLSQLRDLARVSTRSLLRRRFTVISDLDVKDDQSILRFEGKQLVFPSQAHDALRFCYFATTPFVPADLPGLDNEGQMVLARRLVLEGFLDVVELS
jgi:hypothetical protein